MESDQFIDKFQKLSSLQTGGLALGVVASILVAKLAANKITERNVLSQQQAQIKATVEQKQAARSSSLQEVALQGKRPGAHASTFAAREKVMKTLRLSVAQVVQQVSEGTLAVEEVKSAFMMRALDVAVESNYLAEICQHSDLVNQKDRSIQSEYLLRGVTFSVADWIEMEGFDSSCGLASQSIKPRTQDAVVVKVLRDMLKATPLFRSSVNQGAGCLDAGCFTNETSNSTWGRALNPYNKDFSTGGACGGAAGLVASHSVNISLGVDQFGDSRYPAACCGIVAFKPTSSRMSAIGISRHGLRSPICKPVVTPIARRTSDLVYFLRCLWDSKAQNKLDRTVSPLTFNDEYISEEKSVLGLKKKQIKKLVIGYYFDDGITDISEANRQAVLRAKQALEDQGHTLVEFPLCNGLSGDNFLRDGLQLAYRILCSSGQHYEYMATLQGEAPIEERERLLQQSQLSNSFKDKLIAMLNSLHQERMAVVMEVTRELPVEDLIASLGRIEGFVSAFTEYWQSMGFDAVISPAGCLPAIPHKFSSELFCLNSHFLLYNVLDFPAGVVPVKLVSKEDIKGVLSENSGSSESKTHDRFSEFMRLAQLESPGLPVGVQVATLPNRDELCLHVMEAIESSTGFNEMSSIFY